MILFLLWLAVALVAVLVLKQERRYYLERRQRKRYEQYLARLHAAKWRPAVTDSDYPYEPL